MHIYYLFTLLSILFSFSFLFFFGASVCGQWACTLASTCGGGVQLNQPFILWNFYCALDVEPTLLHVHCGKNPRFLLLWQNSDRYLGKQGMPALVFARLGVPDLIRGTGLRTYVCRESFLRTSVYIVAIIPSTADTAQKK